MVRPSVVPLLARFGTCITSATCPAASVTIAHVSDAISLARRPAFIDNKNMTRSRDGERVVATYPRMARSWVGLTILACFPCMVVPQLLGLHTHTRTARLRKSSMSRQAAQAKSPLNPASRLHCATKFGLLWRGPVIIRQPSTETH